MGEVARGDDGPATPPPLLVWTLAAFHTATLVALAVAALHLAGRLGALLAGLDTAVGAAAYLYLWAVTWWTNRRWLAASGPALATGAADPRAVAVGAARWGAVAGLGVLLPALAVGSVLFVGTGACGSQGSRWCLRDWRWRRWAAGPISWWSAPGATWRCASTSATGLAWKAPFPSV